MSHLKTQTQVTTLIGISKMVQSIYFTTEREMIKHRNLEIEIENIVPGISSGMEMFKALELILAELKRLKEIEKKYEDLCK